MQTPVSGKQGILRALPSALHLGSGIVGKRRLPDRNDRADFSNRFRLALFLFRDIFQVKTVLRQKQKPARKQGRRSHYFPPLLTRGLLLFAYF